jgi:Asp-tRNA(Asn)/Glu-tRNA(Gln) amidotransferase C subunit
MTNNEKLNEQIKEIAEMFKASFTKEEIEKLEKDFEEFQKRMLEQKDNKDDEPMFGHH